MTKVIATSQALKARENRKRAFFTRLKRNLAIDSPRCQGRLVNEFKTLILGHHHRAADTSGD